jgi:hypothetical protein
MQVNGWGERDNYWPPRLVRSVIRTQTAPLFRGDSSNVDKALTRIAQAKTRLFKSGSMHLISFKILVAGTGFEPVTFRL